MQTPLPPWFVITDSVITLLATVAVAVFAGVQIWREKQRNHRAEVAANARLSATAYLLRQQILGWIGEQRVSGSNLLARIRSDTWAGDTELAIRRAYEMMAVAGDATEARAAAASKAFVYLLDGIERAEKVLRMSGDDIIDKVDVFSGAEDSIRQSAEILNGAIESLLANEAWLLRRVRKSETFDEVLRDGLRKDAGAS